jgi:hypothetical protein
MDIEVHIGSSFVTRLPVYRHSRIISVMARGWESKSVEDQQAEATRDKAKAKTQLTPAEVVRERELQGLRLSRARVLHQFESARDPRYRATLEKALAELDRRIQLLQAPA